MKHLPLVAASLAAVLCASAGLAILPPSFSPQQPSETEADQRLFARPPLTALRQTPSGGVISLEAFRLIGSGRRQIWVSLGRPSLTRDRSSGRVFQPFGSAAGGFSARLLLSNPGDDRALASAASAAAVSTVSVCQIVRLPPARLTCTASVRLPEGLILEVTGSSVSLPIRQDRFPATALFAFNSLGGVWSPEALEDLEQRGEIVCRVSVLRPVSGGRHVAVLLASTFHLRAVDAVELTQDLILEAATPTPQCQSARTPIDLVAVYNFRSSQRIVNLAPGSGGRYQVLGRGRVNFTLEGAELPGSSWLEIDTEGGALTEHLRFDSQWSVFFVFRIAADSRHRQVNLFSLHAIDNPKACSILAWTTASDPRRLQDSVYSRQHNLPAGFAQGQVTQPLLDARPGAWNRVGISSDADGHQTVHINGARARTAALYRFPERRLADRDQQAALRRALSVGLVRGPRHAMLGTFRCFGVARGALSGEQLHDALATYCQ